MTRRPGTGRSRRCARAPGLRPGTVLGSVPSATSGTQAHFLFEIRPAGAGPIDPRPLLQSWQLLGETQGQPQSDGQPLFGPDAGDALIGEIQLLSERQLRARLLSDSQLRLDTCGQQDIAAGRIDRPVLATLDFLLASGLDPTVSGLECDRSGAASSAGASEHASGDAVTITALNGVPIRGHDGPGSLTELAARRLLSLPAAMRPQQISGPLSLKGTAGTRVRAGSPDAVEIGFNPAAATHATSTAQGNKRAPDSTQTEPAIGSAATVAKATSASSAARLDPELGTAQWRKLITRISHLAEPHVPSVPTSAAVADNPSSPLPTAEPLSASLPLPPAGSPARAAGAGAATASGPLKTKSAGGELGSNTPQLDLAGPLETPLSTPEVVLTTPGTSSILTEKTEFPTLEARTTGLSASSITSYEFQFSPAESEPESWSLIEKTTSPSTEAKIPFNTTAAGNGLYNLRVIVTTAEDGKNGEYRSELRDRLIANGSQVVALTSNPSANLRGKIQLKAEVPQQPPPSVTSVSFQWAPSASPPGEGRWTTIGEPVPVANRSSKTSVSTSFDTTAVPDGSYDFRVVPVDEAEALTSIPASQTARGQHAADDLAGQPRIATER